MPFGFYVQEYSPFSSYPSLSFLGSLEVHNPEGSISLIWPWPVERVSIECRKTKTKVITLANQKGRGQSRGKGVELHH